ncbi:Uma2 family endonuclease [Lipingzhangella halophila]|uniref:Uma2 family endonuclease n=1 Tax=Lipingzhangella halophila TaxID=1783352 RepID=A0A7W7RKX4_9ACTN|nr:Uma2 family endonuclease [Lipingzhangella halophila]MBB4933860.1 Uma2 family endonuclease [Lipingzhangella halophila]
MTLMVPSECEYNLPTDRPLTVDDLEHTPDDGRRYELDDGRLDVTPAPVGLHSRAEGRLLQHLGNLAPDWAEVHPGPGVTLNDARTSHLIPDLAVIRIEDFSPKYQTRPPVLAVEVLSPESVFRDTNKKKREYAALGIGNYWIVNPSLDKTGILVFRLENGTYREVAQAFGGDVLTVDHPFPVRIVPEWLVADGPWRAKISGPDSDTDETSTAEPADEGPEEPPGERSEGWGTGTSIGGATE